jgi:hypothetical protein
LLLLLCVVMVVVQGDFCPAVPGHFKVEHKCVTRVR